MKTVLATLHAKYVHTALALPYLAAACGGLVGVTTVIREFTVNEPVDRVLRALVAERAEVVAFSCYIWNIEATLRLCADLKKLHPDIIIILGGPEVSFDCFALLEQNPAVNCIIRGEGEETFRECLAALQQARQCHHDTSQSLRQLAAIPGLVWRIGDELIAGKERTPIASLDSIPSPFAAALANLAKPLVYYETSRGCPFSCAFCMSSRENGVRSFSLARIKADLDLLTSREVRTIKLVDRTFNYDAGRANLIWEHILATNRVSRFHFEIAADLLTEHNLSLLERVPPGLFRFEIGVQSGNEQTLARVARHSDLERLSINVRRLVATTGVTVHLDLVAGLPYEDYAGFLRSLQQVFDLLGPHDAQVPNRQVTPPFIQIEPLKVLKGSPMRQIAEDEGYLHSAAPPYKILRTPWLSYQEICRIETVARLLDLFFNSGRCTATLALLAETTSLATAFDRLANYWESMDQGVELSLAGLFEELWEFAKGFVPRQKQERLQDAICYDYCRAEYPTVGRLPRFFPIRPEELKSGRNREKQAALCNLLRIGKESRVRTFSHRFASDPRLSSAKQRDVTLLFVYIATPGKGFEVRVNEA